AGRKADRRAARPCLPRAANPPLHLPEAWVRHRGCPQALGRAAAVTIPVRVAAAQEARRGEARKVEARRAGGWTAAPRAGVHKATARAEAMVPVAEHRPAALKAAALQADKAVRILRSAYPCRAAACLASAFPRRARVVRAVGRLVANRAVLLPMARAAQPAAPRTEAFSEDRAAAAVRAAAALRA